MPLRDHFHPPLTKQAPWDALHGAWPTMIVMELNKRLPADYVAAPNIRLGTHFEIDVAASAKGDRERFDAGNGSTGGGIATAVWAPPKPTLTLETDLPELDEYEVRIVETESRRLVAAVEIISPANKDRPEHRRAFVARCAALLQQGVSVSIVDVVTTRRFNLYGDLLDLIGQADPALPAPTPPWLYAVAVRSHEQLSRKFHPWNLETWAHSLSIGDALPTLPLWLEPDLAVPLNLEDTYERTCGILRIH